MGWGRTHYSVSLPEKIIGTSGQELYKNRYSFSSFPALIDFCARLYILKFADSKKSSNAKKIKKIKKIKKTLEQHQVHCSGVFVVTFQSVQTINPAFLLLTSTKCFSTECLTNFRPILPLKTRGNHQRSSDFLMFSWDLQRKYLPEKVWINQSRTYRNNQNSGTYMEKFSHIKFSRVLSKKMQAYLHWFLLQKFH